MNERPTVNTVTGLVDGVGLDASAVELDISGPEEWLPSIFRVTEAASVAVGATTVAAAELLRRRRGGSSITASVDRRHAAASFRSEQTIRIDGEQAGAKWDPLAGNYRTADGWIRLHTNFDHHRAAALGVLGCEAERDAVERAAGTWDGVELEHALAEAGMAATVLRSTDEWRSTAQGAALDQLPIIELDRIDDAAPLPWAGEPTAAAAGLRVLDLTRVIAGPTCGKVLAAHGADVMRIGAPHVPAFEELIVDTGFGKRNVDLDLRDATAAAIFRDLVRTADVVIQGFRPGALAAHGFGPDELAALRPGLVIVDLSAYGRLGPWASRRGFDSIVQIASGIAHAGMVAAGSDEPKPLPAQALDHASGWLAALAVLAGVARQREQGGTWHGQVSLARTGRWIEDFGRIDGLTVPDPTIDDIRDLLTTTASAFGEITHVKAVGSVDGDPPTWQLPPAQLGSHEPTWTPRRSA